MSARLQTVLLTGASGVVGRALVEQLEDVRIIALVHREDTVPSVAEVVRCDLRMERMGLSRARWDWLSREVDTIVHSAGLTRWGQPYERYEEINVHGTARVVELAARAGAPVHFLGTSFVRAMELGRLDELAPDNVVVPYIRSKLAAERVLQESGVPHSIFRPTNLVGNSRTGASSRPQIVQRLSSWICRGRAPYFPAHRGNVIDVLPVDVLASAVVGAIAEGTVSGPWWVTAGERAMTSEQTLDVLIEHARMHGREIPRAPICDPRDSMPIRLEDVPGLSRTYMKVLLDVSAGIHVCGGALPSSLPELEERFGVPRVSVREAFRLSLEHWAAVQPGVVGQMGQAG